MCLPCKIKPEGSKILQHIVQYKVDDDYIYFVSYYDEDQTQVEFKLKLTKKRYEMFQEHFEEGRACAFTADYVERWFPDGQKNFEIDMHSADLKKWNSCGNLIDHWIGCPTNRYAYIKYIIIIKNCGKNLYTYCNEKYEEKPFNFFIWKHIIIPRMRKLARKRKDSI